jgi:Flp pilus assembly protein TadD
MSSWLQDGDRRVIPRWRDSFTAVLSGEALSATSGSIVAAPDGFFAEKLESWQRNRTLGHAADVLSSAIVLGRRAELPDAAAFILENAELAPVPLVQAARVALGDSAGPSAELPPDLDVENIQLEIARIRSRLRLEPRDPVGWVDLARLYACIGVDHKADAAVKRALALHSDSRFVLRSASRLFVHLGDPDRAHWILKRSKLNDDPWIVAAEIAVATVAGAAPVMLKQGSRILESRGASPFETAELASAVGMIDLLRSRLRPAKKLFKKALRHPNDNVVAQVAWASRRVGSIKLSDDNLGTPRSFEARAWSQYVNQQWLSAVNEAWKWFCDEPFSSRSLELATFIATTHLEDYEAAIRMCRRGLEATPDSAPLRNNLVFALASAGLIEEAEREHARAHVAVDDPMSFTWIATTGLLAFRRGDPALGRRLYQRAIDRAKVLGDRHNAAVATIYWAREELLAGTTEASNALETAAEHARHDDSPTTKMLIERLHGLPILRKVR